jgi:DNA-binding GntR family transcriptional regulator
MGDTTRQPAAEEPGSDLAGLLENARAGGARPGEKRYQWLIRVLHDARSNGLAAERLLPTELQLAEQFQVSRQTVRRALDELARAGEVTRFAGRGTYLLPAKQRHEPSFTSSQNLLAPAQTARYEIVAPLSRGIDIVAAGRMRQPTDVTYSASFRRFQDDVPIGFTTVYMPVHIGELLAGLGELEEAGHATTTSVIELLDQRLPGGVARAEQSITATGLPALAAQHLERTAAEVALQVDLLFFDQQNAIIELQSSYFLPDAYSYRSIFRRTPSQDLRARSADFGVLAVVQLHDVGVVAAR